MLEHLIPFLIASVLLTVSPGPDIIYVLMQSIVNGKKAGLVTAFGLVTGILVHTSLVAFGVSAIIVESANLYLFIKVLGSLYLFYLAFKTWMSNPDLSLDPQVAPKRTVIPLFRHGFIMNVLNPKVTIFFLAFFPGFMWDPEGNTVFQLYTLGFLFMFQALLIFSVVALLSGKISSYLRKNPSWGYILKWVQITFFIGIGVLILL